MDAQDDHDDDHSTLQTPDAEAVDDESNPCCMALHGHTRHEGDGPFGDFFSKQDRPGRSATCPSPGRWSHPLQHSSWEPLQHDEFNRARVVSHQFFKHVLRVPADIMHLLLMRSWSTTVEPTSHCGAHFSRLPRLMLLMMI